MIELQHISKVFNRGKVNEVIALNDVSLTIQKEEFVVLVGSNGSGKTTLLNVISGAEIGSNGKVLISNKDVTRLAEYRRSKWIARVFQNPLSGTASDLSILDNFRLAAIRTSQKKLVIGVNEAFKKQVRDKIATLGMGLENKLEQAMGTLSGGQRQALTLLMSVMDDTQILLLDEPTAALDPRSAALILETANNLIKEYKLTAVLITHNLKDAHQYGNRLIQMNEGKVLRDLQSAEKSALELPKMYDWFN
ncbi:MAG TPA: ATP-binding cassette domain-containing protein [Bacteroidia bacterium]|jgi:putative ABC transport system ATP-binding protein|nr:ATP-binding cassette domain-containing protein [Bacteroidia bacterium]